MAKRLVTSDPTVRARQVECVLLAVAELNYSEKVAVIAEMHRQLVRAEATEKTLVVVQATAETEGSIASTRLVIVDAESVPPGLVVNSVARMAELLTPEMWAAWAQAFREEELERAQTSAHD